MAVELRRVWHSVRDWEWLTIQTQRRVAVFLVTVANNAVKDDAEKRREGVSVRRATAKTAEQMAGDGRRCDDKRSDEREDE